MAITIPRSLGRSFIESFMIDKCRITRNVSGVFNATLDEETGELVDEVEDIVVYEGKCTIARILTRDKEFYEGEMPEFANGYKLLIPASVVGGQLGDTLVFTSTSHDPRILDLKFRITDIEVFTHTAYRRLSVTAIENSLGSLKGME